MFNEVIPSNIVALMVIKCCEGVLCDDVVYLMKIYDHY